ncbi:MAG: aminodeoxychorismate lyase, partial [Alphaproteobacteria bacterium 62-8]
LLYQLGVRMRGQAALLKAGEYAIPARASMAEITALLISGRVVLHRLTAAEGLTSAMIVTLVKDDPVLAGDVGPVPPEGSLLPETYLFARGMTRSALLAKMKQAQTDFLDAHWAKRASGLPFQTKEQAIILASIVEKETAIASERRHIAAVFINRLKRGMKLQSDPTIIYGLTRGYPLGRAILQSEIDAPTPFNTYVIPALPPSPICNPGKDSILAVLNPIASDDLYFVADGHGGHVFAPTNAEHEKNVARWRKIRSERAKMP